eukprot:3478517-Amphidinium_carterae.1
MKYDNASSVNDSLYSECSALLNMLHVNLHDLVSNYSTMLSSSHMVCDRSVTRLATRTSRQAGRCLVKSTREQHHTTSDTTQM